VAPPLALQLKREFVNISILLPPALDAKPFGPAGHAPGGPGISDQVGDLRMKSAARPPWLWINIPAGSSGWWREQAIVRLANHWAQDRGYRSGSSLTPPPSTGARAPRQGRGGRPGALRP
jgi:hypothetical protein